MPLLSVIMPVYNEADTVRQVLEKVACVNIDKEIIVVDDGSSDPTYRVLREGRFNNLKVIHHSTNRGKGAAVTTGLSCATGEFMIIQDADLEYDPADYPKLLQAACSGAADMVLGARFTRQYHGLLIPRLGNRFLTAFLNLLFGTYLNDCFTCYKLFRTQTARDFGLKAQNFNIEIEILAKAVKRGLRIAEVPINYVPRNYSQGKKIRLKDGVMAMFSIIKYRFSS